MFKFNNIVRFDQFEFLNFIKRGMLNSNQKQEISRYDLKKELEGIQSFDISSFGQSKNESLGLRGILHSNQQQSIFPNIDAPTLQLLEDSEYNIRYLDPEPKAKPNNSKKPPQVKKHEYYEDLTARNSQSSTAYQYEEKLQKMAMQMEKLTQKLQRQRKEKQLLHEKIGLMEVQHRKIVDDLKEKNKEQKEQIKMLKDRQIKNAREKETLEKQIQQIETKNSIGRGSRAGSISSGGNSHQSSTMLMTSYMEDPSYFCPQLLSPQQTVTLLSKLLKKVSKSSKMIKELTGDPYVKSILGKIQKIKETK